MSLHIFINFAPRDTSFRDKLVDQLSIFEINGIASLWDRSMIQAGSDTRHTININLEKSDIVILLLSSDYLSDESSPYSCSQIHKVAIEKGKQIVPVIIRACGWKYVNELKNYEKLPKKEERIVPANSWGNIDEAFGLVTDKIGELLEGHQALKEKGRVLGAHIETRERNLQSSSEHVEVYEHGYAIFIGIKYGHWYNVKDRNGNSMDLVIPGTLNDVEDLQNHFLDNAKAAYKPENIISITEENATAENILKGLEELGEKVRGDSEASVLIYFAGHGETYEDDYFLVPYDFNINKYLLERKIDKDKIVHSKDFAKGIANASGKKNLVILDCCHAENMTRERNLDNRKKAFSRSFLFVEELEQEVKAQSGGSLEEQLQKGEGTVIMASCNKDQVSFEFEKNGRINGLFTIALLECLSGEKNIEGDGWVRLIDLMRYIPWRVGSYSKQNFNKEQNPKFPKIEGYDGPFVICAYNIAKARGIGTKETFSINNPEIDKPPIHLGGNDMELEKFKTDLNEILDNQGFQGVPEVLGRIAKCNYSYNKPTFAILRNDSMSRLTRLDPSPFIVQLKNFIGSII